MAKKQKQDALDQLATGDLTHVIALMLWKNRLKEPDMFMKIEEKDIQGLKDCAGFLKVTPEVKVYRPEGLPAQEAIPATRNRRAVPGRAATPPKPYVIVTLLGRDKKGITGPLKPVENNEADYDNAQAVTELRRARDKAPELAQRLIQQANSGEYSLSDMQDAADALMTLARGT